MWEKVFFLIFSAWLDCNKSVGNEGNSCRNLNKNNSSCQTGTDAVRRILSISITDWKTQKLRMRWDIILSFKMFNLHTFFLSQAALRADMAHAILAFAEATHLELCKRWGVGQFILPGLWDSVTISQTSIVPCEVLSRSLVLFSFPLVFPNVFLQSSVRTSWHKYKWPMTDDIDVQSQLRREGQSTTSRWRGGNRPCPLHNPYSHSKHSNKKKMTGGPSNERPELKSFSQLESR